MSSRLSASWRFGGVVAIGLLCTATTLAAQEPGANGGQDQPDWTRIARYTLIVVIAIVYFVIRRRVRKSALERVERRDARTEARREATTRAARHELVLDDAPDRPIAFGYKTAWLAVRCGDPAKVMNTLGISEASPANWGSGLPASHSDHVFVTPAIRGFVLVTGEDLAGPGAAETRDFVTAMLSRLSSAFGEAQWFATHREVEYHAWARAEDGELRRAFEFLGESDGTLWEFGEPTPVEQELDLESPNQEAVMLVAREWSLDPASLETLGLDASSGFVGRMHRASLV